MNKKYFIGIFILMAIVFVYLLLLSLDVYRIQRLKPLGGIYAVRVFDYGWHSGLVLNMNDIPKVYRRHLAMFKNKRWVEISWGDNHFYRNRKKSMFWPLAIAAIAWPTRSVLHVLGFNMPLHALYGFTRVQAIYVSKKDYLRLLQFVSSFFVSDSIHSFSIIERGLYGDSWFLTSKGTYIFPFTCNVWTARALKAANVPLTPVLYQLPGLLMRILRERGKKYPKVGKNVKLAGLPI